MPETQGLLARVALFNLRGGLAPAPGSKEDTPSSAGLQWHYRLMALQVVSVGSVRLLKGNKRSIDGQLPRARLEFDATRSPTLQTSVPGVRRWARPSVGDE